MRNKGRPKKAADEQKPKKPRGRPRKSVNGRPKERIDGDDPSPTSELGDDEVAGPSKKRSKPSEPGESGYVVPVQGIHTTASQLYELSNLVCCRECSGNVVFSTRSTTKGMYMEFLATCQNCGDVKSTNTPNLVLRRKKRGGSKYDALGLRKDKKNKDSVLQKTENVNYAHVSSFLNNGLGYCGLRHYCNTFNARCMTEVTFINYTKQVIGDTVEDTNDNIMVCAEMVRKMYEAQEPSLGEQEIIDVTVSYATTYHQFGSDYCLVGGAVIELVTGLVLDFDVANMYCHTCKINAKKIVEMTSAEMTEWFSKHTSTCEIREWCDDLFSQGMNLGDSVEPKLLETYIAKKLWSRSIEKHNMRYTNLVHGTDEKVVEALQDAKIYNVEINVESKPNFHSTRKSSHARESFYAKLKAKAPRERVTSKDRILYVYAMSVPEYNKFAIRSNEKLRTLLDELESMEIKTEG